jgi:2-dehydropantoate 2-reductase
MRHKPTEIDYLNGYVVRQGAALGIATPASRVLVALVRALESRSPESP